ncbi:hypothetical protein E1212_08705 [Jiangella ureilytica]|uniref:Uncharacterized protein n=1 Tax=Jiangella ureilytica TaxID=2530374 RepID=A0A4R4RR25_9ACTN|nr:hypothetical protein [Jiangella ureilytica]TDC52391.1 hypothetical protein E1212_08705 [Jiangella ureilytica]
MTAGETPGGVPAGDGGAWQLTAELKPKAPEPAATASGAAGGPAEPAAPGWDAAAADLRATVKWMVAAFAAVGAAMFAKGFVTTPTLSWADDTWQLVFAWLVGAAGVVGVGLLIYQAVQLLRPTAFELGNLPEKYVAEIDANPRFYLPSDADTLEGYLAKLRALRVQATRSAGDVAVGERALAAAEKATPPDPAAVAAAERELDRATVRRESVQKALGVYSTVRESLLDRAGYWAPDRGLNRGGTVMLVAGILAAGGGIGYQLLLAAPDPDDGDGGGSASPPAIGELVRSDGAAGQELWRQLDLEACQADPASARIAVVVASGAGTEADPYVVSTLPTATCRAATFTVVDAVARVSVPEQQTIDYQPAEATQSP